jgi:tRNA(fMet)-specific endonuclease VapC
VTASVTTPVTTLYLLDTDTCAFVLRRTSDTLLERIQAVPLSQQAMSVVTYAELLYGVQLSSKKKANQAAVDALAHHLAVLDWSRDAALHYAQIRADLKKRGAMIGANDLMIAAQALSVGAVVVTNNTKDFTRVKGLAVENWLQ